MLTAVMSEYVMMGDAGDDPEWAPADDEAALSAESELVKGMTDDITQAYVEDQVQRIL